MSAEDSMIGNEELSPELVTLRAIDDNAYAHVVDGLGRKLYVDSPEHRTEIQNLADVFRTALLKLSPLHERVLRLRMGLSPSGKEHTFQEIGDQLRPDLDFDARRNFAWTSYNQSINRLIRRNPHLKGLFESGDFENP